MKKQFFAFIIGGFTFLSVFAFKTDQVTEYVPTNATCNVSNLDGFYIYVDATPVKKYRLVGVITNDELGNNRGSQQYTSLRNRFVNKASEQFRGEADGLIFKLCDGCVDKVNVIKFD